MGISHSCPAQVDARRGFRVAALDLRHGDFATLHATLRAALDRAPAACDARGLPKLPPPRRGDAAADAAGLEERRDALDAYLRGCVAFARDKPDLEGALLRFLRLARDAPPPRPRRGDHKLVCGAVLSIVDDVPA